MFKVASFRNTSIKTVYNIEDRSIMSKPESPLRSGLTVMINYLQLELATNGVIVGVNGYCPHEGWIFKELITIPEAQDILLYYDNINTLSLGSVLSLNDNEKWPVYYDIHNHILCLDSGQSATIVAEILPDVVLEINDEGIPARLWCKLENANLDLALD